MSEPMTTDYCVACRESPDSGSHLPHGHEYLDPRGACLAERVRLDGWLCSRERGHEGPCAAHPRPVKSRAWGARGDSVEVMQFGPPLAFPPDCPTSLGDVWIGETRPVFPPDPAKLRERVVRVLLLGVDDADYYESAWLAPGGLVDKIVAAIGDAPAPPRHVAPLPYMRQPAPPPDAHLREELARMTIERDALRDRLASLQPDRWRWRGVEDPCERCGGAGCRMYGSGATWRGGAGTATGERDVCDRCWGTGDKYRTGADLRALRSEEDGRVAERAVDELARSVGIRVADDGVSLGTVRGAIPHLIIALDRVADKRGAPAAAFLPDLAISLGNVLRRAIGMPERKS